MISVDGIEITPTIFPDKTSQVWHIEPKYLRKMFSGPVTIRWDFESEGEVMHLLQLVTLIRSTNREAIIKVKLSYLPYARQDKDINNYATFALHTFLSLMSLAVQELEVFDPHSTHLLDLYFGDNYKAVEPNLEISYAMNGYNGCSPDLICYPDKGASTRYPCLNGVDSVYMEKTRDQATGKINGIELYGEVNGKSLLIVDDLCDGGRTFIEAAKVLRAAGATEVNLYVSHGIFSHPLGVSALHQAGIMKVYTRDGLVSDINEKHPTD